MVREPLIEVNGNKLTIVESMVVRVAITWFKDSVIQPDALGDDDMGKLIADGYATILERVMKKMRE